MKYSKNRLLVLCTFLTLFFAVIACNSNKGSSAPTCDESTVQGGFEEVK